MSDKLLAYHGTLRNEWVKLEYRAFVADVFELTNPKRANRRVAVWATAWIRIDERCHRPQQLTYEALVDLLFADGLRAHRRVIDFLVRRTLLHPLEPREWHFLIERCRCRRILAAAMDRPYGSAFVAYYDHLMATMRIGERRGWTGRQMRPRPRTVASNLFAAKTLLDVLGIRAPEQVRAITNEDLAAFLIEKPGYRDAIRPFLRYINLKLRPFKKLVLGSTKRLLHEDWLLEPKAFAGLLTRLFSERGAKSRDAAICLLSVLYAQSARRVVSIRLSDLQIQDDGCYSIATDKAVVCLDVESSAILREWLQLRGALRVVKRDRDNEYLFPGSSPGTHVSLSAVGLVLKSYGLNSRTAFSTAVFNLFQHGVDQPKTLVRQLGISMPSALKYWGLTGPMARKALAHAKSRNR